VAAAVVEEAVAMGETEMVAGGSEVVTMGRVMAVAGWVAMEAVVIGEATREPAGSLETGAMVAVVGAKGTEEMGMEVVVMGEAELVAGGSEAVVMGEAAREPAGSLKTGAMVAVVGAEGTEEMGMEVVVMGEAELVAGGLEVVGMESVMAVMAAVG
jgi:primosomal replication protein N